MDVWLLGVQISETNKPSLGNDVAVGPGAEGSLAVEIGGTVRNRGELEGGAGAGEGVDEEGISGYVSGIIRLINYERGKRTQK